MKNKKNTILFLRLSAAVIVILLVFIVIPRIPYLNLLTSNINGIILWIISFLLIGNRNKSYFILGLLAYILSLIFTMMGKINLADDLGNFTFLTLLTGTLLSFYKFLKYE